MYRIIESTTSNFTRLMDTPRNWEPCSDLMTPHASVYPNSNGFVRWEAKGLIPGNFYGIR
jgi:hypothetical protein